MSLGVYGSLEFGQDPFRDRSKYHPSLSFLTFPFAQFENYLSHIGMPLQPSCLNYCVFGPFWTWYNFDIMGNTLHQDYEKQDHSIETVFFASLG